MKKLINYHLPLILTRDFNVTIGISENSEPFTNVFRDSLFKLTMNNDPTMPTTKDVAKKYHQEGNQAYF